MLLRADCFEEDDELVIQVEVPGISAPDLDVRVGCGVLRVQVDCSGPGAERHYHRRERRAGPEVREIALPAPVITSLALASLDEGLLTVRLPLGRENADWGDAPVLDLDAETRG